MQVGEDAIVARIDAVCPEGDGQIHSLKELGRTLNVIKKTLPQYKYGPAAVRSKVDFVCDAVANMLHNISPNAKEWVSSPWSTRLLDRLALFCHYVVAVGKNGNPSKISFGAAALTRKYDCLVELRQASGKLKPEDLDEFHKFEWLLSPAQLNTVNKFSLEVTKSTLGRAKAKRGQEASDTTEKRRRFNSKKAECVSARPSASANPLFD